MLNEALRLIRVYHDLSQTQLSYELGISNSFISELESGRKIPSLEVLNKYAKQFDLPLSSILFFSENLEKPKVTDKLRLNVARKAISLLDWVARTSKSKAIIKA